MKIKNKRLKYLDLIKITTGKGKNKLYQVGYVIGYGFTFFGKRGYVDLVEGIYPNKKEIWFLGLDKKDRFYRNDIKNIEILERVETKKKSVKKKR